MEFPLDQARTTIGRHSANSLVISDAQASRSHCVIEKLDDGFQVRDLNSSNGTKLNGELIHSAPFEAGDIVCIGATTLKLIVPGAKGDDDALTEADVIDDVAPDELVPIDNEFVDREGAMMHIATGVDYEQALVSLAESLPNHTFGEHEIALVNSPAWRCMMWGPSRPRTPSGRRSICFGCFCWLDSAAGRRTFISSRGRSVTRRVLRIDGTMVDVAPAQPGGPSPGDAHQGDVRSGHRAEEHDSGGAFRGARAGGGPAAAGGLPRELCAGGLWTEMRDAHAGHRQRAALAPAI